MRSAVSQHRRTHSGGNAVTLHKPPNAAPTDLRKDSSWWAVGQMTDFFFFLTSSFKLLIQVVSVKVSRLK